MPASPEQEDVVPIETTRPPDLAEPTGKIIGPYKLREKIGEGGCGVVYVADQEHPTPL